MMQPMMNAAAPHLVKHAMPAMERYGGPMALAGKLLGLSQDELKAGVPWWGWTAIGVGTGAVVTYLLREKIEKVVG